MSNEECTTHICWRKTNDVVADNETKCVCVWEREKEREREREREKKERGGEREGVKEVIFVWMWMFVEIRKQLGNLKPFLILKS